MIIPAHQWCNQDNLEYNDTPNVGSLYDDIESLRAMLNDPDLSCTFVDFDRLASVLRAISQEFNPPYELNNKELFNNASSKQIRKKVVQGRIKELADKLHKHQMILSQIE